MSFKMSTLVVTFPQCHPALQTRLSSRFIVLESAYNPSHEGLKPSI